MPMTIEATRTITRLRVSPVAGIASCSSVSPFPPPLAMATGAVDGSGWRARSLTVYSRWAMVSSRWIMRDAADTAGDTRGAMARTDSVSAAPARRSTT